MRCSPFKKALPLSGLMLGLSGAPAVAWAADHGLPQRNLLIEWRMSGQGQSQMRNQGVRTGQIIVDSRGGVIGRTSIGTETVQTENQTDTVQQVQVLNGGRAHLYVGRSQPYTVWQWAWTGQAGSSGTLGAIGPQTGGAGNSTNSSGAGSPGSGVQPNATGNSYPGSVVPQTVWIDIGQGLSVRPRWAGGQSVVVELEAQARQPAQLGGAYSGQIEPDGQTRHIEVGSTLSVPLGQWAVVARSGGLVRKQQSGSLSTRDLDDNQSEQLEIRISVP